MIQLLLQNGADINFTTAKGDSVLCLAVAKGYDEIVKFVIKNGADFNFKCANQLPPLFWAAQNGNFTFSHSNSFLGTRRWHLRYLMI